VKSDRVPTKNAAGGNATSTSKIDKSKGTCSLFLLEKKQPCKRRSGSAAQKEKVPLSAAPTVIGEVRLYSNHHQR